MKKIFEKVNIGGIETKNRIIRSATEEGSAINDGDIGEELISIYNELSVGGVGIIITSMVGVDKNSRVFPNMIKTYGDNFISGLKQIINNAHENNSKIVVQLAHNGAKAAPDDGSDPLAPSDITLSKSKPAREMTIKEINDLVRNFGLAALKCKEAGADGVQIHGAHGYLVSQFLSPFFNKRNDEYGGSISNRSRIVFEIYDEIRKKVGNNYPIWIKINSTDMIDGGLTFDECLWVCKELDKLEINGIELSGGLGLSKKDSPVQMSINKNEKGTFADVALILAENVKATVISVGGYRRPDIIEEWLNKGKVEAISLCRLLICEPDLVNIWNSGDKKESKCISCNKCFGYSDGFGCKVFRK